MRQGAETACRSSTYLPKFPKLVQNSYNTTNECASGRFEGTKLGCIASHYCVTYKPMSTYNQHLRPNMSTLELFYVFVLSKEFTLLTVWQDEKLKWSKLLKQVPTPVKESINEPATKHQRAFVDLHLAAEVGMFCSGYRYGLCSAVCWDIFEICLKRDWAVPAKAGLDLCKIVEKRMWGSITLLRQFKSVLAEIIRKARGKQFSWYRYFDLNLPDRMKSPGG